MLTLWIQFKQWHVNNVLVPSLSREAVQSSVSGLRYQLIKFRQPTSNLQQLRDSEIWQDNKNIEILYLPGKHFFSKSDPEVSSSLYHLHFRPRSSIIVCFIITRCVWRRWFGFLLSSLNFKLISSFRKNSKTIYKSYGNISQCKS